MGHKISKEQIDPGVKDHIMSFVGDVADLETEVNTDIISAVNSLMVDRVDNAENMGKLANAIGEPVTANHSVDEAVEGLGELLSTFKTNMMNSGVMVESSDKFKQLIDKIKGLTEGEGNKGIQFAEGQATFDADRTLTSNNCYVNYDLDFVPTYLFIKFDAIFNANEWCYNIILTNWCETIINNSAFQLALVDVTDKSCLIADHIGSNDATILANTVYYCAIGVGEEDTTLRDSLASILEEEGVSVTEEDTMADLITKVDEEFDRKNANSGLDIISATELPATGKENQICVITDTAPTKFIVTTNYQDTTDDTNIALYLSNTASHDWISTCIPMVNGNVQMNYYVHKLMQGDKRLPAYIYKNNQWNQIAYEYFAIMENGVYYNNDLHGGFKGEGTVFNVEEGTGITFMGTWTSANSYYMFSTNTPIDFNQFTKLKLTTHSLNGVKPNLNYAIISIYATGNSVSKKDTHGYSFNNGGWTVPYTIRRIPFSATPTEVEYDISDWQGTYYITFECELPSSSYGIPIIDDIKLY